jgi:Protein of unknown function (DUF5672)
MMPLPLDLPEVTLCAVDTRSPALALAALQRSMASIRFGRVLLFSHGDAGAAGAHGIERIDCGPIESAAAYSDFMLRRLLPFVADPARWEPAFLGVDYLGAPWGKAPDGHFVGNGGFSLRSRRLLQSLQDPALAGRLHHPEDICIGQTLRSDLETRHGIVFGSLEMARRFAYENEPPAQGCFGFHGMFNLPAVIGAPAFSALTEQLPADVLAGRDGFKTARALLRRGQPELALKLLERRAAIRPLDARSRLLRWQCRWRAPTAVPHA